MNAAALGALDHEELHVRRGERTGIHVVVAIHSTTLGPALGGARLWRYGTPGDGIADALRLSEAMTLKAAAAGLDLGGGKCVMCLDAASPDLDAATRRELMLDLGDLVESIGGRYVTAEDVGTSPADMEVIAERTRHVVGLPPERGGAGDPSPLTARGVLSAMKASLAHLHGSGSLTGRRVCVVGLGHVGLPLARMAAAEGAELIVSDIAPDAREQAQRLGAEWVTPEHAMLTPCDVLAPCALGGAIDTANAERIETHVVCGSANNVLADDRLAEVLHARGILYAPDFIANAGGLIGVASELAGSDPRAALDAVDGIGAAVSRVLALASAEEITTLAAAREVAAERLRSGAPAVQRPHARIAAA